MKLNKISKAFYINLDRRSDRMRHMENNTPFDVERYNAVDSVNLTLTKQIDQLFSKKLNSLTKAEIACSLSHYQLWKQLVNDNDAENYLILEDDAVFKSGFTQFWNQAFSEEIPSNFMLIYLGGCQPWNKPSYHKVLQSKNQYFNTIKKNDFFTPADHYWHMNASSYIISKQAASLLCQWVDQQGFDAALDVFMIMFFNKNKLFSTPDRVYHLNPLMSYQLHEKNNNTKSDKNSDIRFNKDKFTKTKHKISNINSIPKVLHVSWNNKDILSSQSPLILNGLKNFETINPDWKIEISDDDDVDNYIKKHVSVKHYNLIKNKHIVQKTDLWRLLKIHNEGGLYIDIDRYVNIPMAKIINKHTKCILPICGRSDFSQDFVCGVPNFYIHKNAINSYLKFLELGKSVFECGPISYMHSVSESLCGYKAERRPGNKFWNDAISTINQSPDIESYIEGDSFDKILFKYDPKTFVYLNGDSQDLYTEFKNQKADFYNSQSIEHWNIHDRNYHKNYKNNNQELTLIWQFDPRDKNQSYESDWLRGLFSDLNYKEIIDCKHSVFQDNAIVIYNDIWPKTQESPRQEALYNYLDKISKYDNVSIVHLGDEFTHAKTEHYKNFKTVIRTTYKDSIKDFANLIQIPLGYKQGFYD